MIVDPDRFKVDLDLGDGNTPLRLWYTPEAIWKICEKLPQEVPFGEVTTMLRQFTPPRLLLFIWAGRIWEEPKLSIDAIESRLRKPLRPMLEIWTEVQGALLLGLTGIRPGESKANEPDPQQPTGANGAGKNASSSPSASSDYP